MVSAADRAKHPARASVWLEGGKAARSAGRKAEQPSGLDRERITAAAVRLLDAEGLAKFSMRRLAAELNVTAMSVYWYVDTKDDLLELAIDAVLGELDLPEPAADGDDWRDRLRALAVGYRSLLVRHPWVSPLIGRFLNIGPHAMAFALCVQQVIGSTGLPAHAQTGATQAVFQFVYGFGTIEGQFMQRCASAGMSQDEYFREAMATIYEQPGYEKDFRRATELMEARGGDTVEEMRERDFDFGLKLLVAGIEAMTQACP
ncbi:TetR/AcrR family transcriptional regulator [Streptomyces sp. CB03238]|uniref:TetR/AcrR family transcriptional regulator n=1 Tax=Streptomyces sp. CB03238 TaxID=1907777 RepID=UPI000A101D1D|nr:TetR/AcrR family transcriptional regulator [Streptomyces sp. CB03238]ORT57923.1 TetR family transcriptional regulator [Streptomyces sp. CB03238]